MKFILISVLLGFGTINAKSQCEREEMLSGEIEISKMDNWKDVHSAYLKFSLCQNMGIETQFTETIGRILSVKWPKLQELETVIKSDPTFEAFLIKHLDETLSQEYAKRIASNAKLKCKKSSKPLCKKIESALASHCQ